MASAVAVPSRALLEAINPARKRPLCECLKIAQTTYNRRAVSRRSISTESPQSTTTLENESRPRWAQTPPAMRAPFPITTRPNREPFVCNSDPATLDEAYNNLLGPGGSSLLTEETKWLAITHKSFDHGRRGFNDRLSFYGMMNEG